MNPYPAPNPNPSLIDKIGDQHKMSTYLHWMETLPEVLNVPAEDITWDDDIGSLSNG
jgi:hypothetical protein